MRFNLKRSRSLAKAAIAGVVNYQRTGRSETIIAMLE
jgi:hypothetical protein